MLYQVSEDASIITFAFSAAADPRMERKYSFPPPPKRKTITFNKGNQVIVPRILKSFPPKIRFWIRPWAREKYSEPFQIFQTYYTSYKVPYKISKNIYGIRDASPSYWSIACE